MPKITYENVDAYLAAAPDEARSLLLKMRELIMTTVPEAEEKISYNVPFYKYYGEFVGFAFYSKHISFGFGSDGLEETTRQHLEEKGYKLGKGTLQILFSQKVPEEEIKQILIYKAGLNEMKFDRKNSK